MNTLNFLLDTTWCISITSDTPFSFSETDMVVLQAHVPGLTVLESEPTVVDFQIIHIQSERAFITQAANSITFHTAWGDTLPDDIIHTLYGIARRLYLKHNLYPVHGACVALPDKNVLIVGHSGAGKTTVTLELLKQAAVRLFSGNKTVIQFQKNSMEAIAGTPTVTVREADKQPRTLAIEQTFTHWGRETFTLASTHRTTTTPLKIDAVIIVKLTNYTETCIKLEGLSLVHTLYPYCVDAVNADIVLADAATVFPGDVAIEHKEQLVQNLIACNSTLPVYAITGPASYIATTISEL